MTSVQLLLSESRANENLLLRSFMERISEMTCLREACGEADVEGCVCPPCIARDCLDRVEVLKDLLNHES